MKTLLFGNLMKSFPIFLYLLFHEAFIDILDPIKFEVKCQSKDNKPGNIRLILFSPKKLFWQIG